MTTLNTIIEEEKKEFDVQFAETPELSEIERKELVEAGFSVEAEPLIPKTEAWMFTTTAMQRAYEAGKADSAQENTPDTEGSTVQDAVQDAVQDENTPDTKKFDVIGWLRNTYGLDDDDCLSAGRVQELCESLVYDFQTSRDTYWKERVRKEVESKDGAYHERNVLVCALTKLFPAYLARHNEDDETWERDWMWIVYIDLPTGQVSWHIHDSEQEMFNHLEVKENNWDGHNTERKYQRLQALDNLK